MTSHALGRLAFLILIVNLAAHAQTAALPTLSCSPAPCVLPNVQVSQSSFILPSSLSLDPANAQHLVTGESNLTCTAVYVTSDGGATWTNQCSKAGGFPVYAFGPSGVINGAGTGPDRHCAPDCDENVVQFSSSTDDGATWSNPVVAAPHALGFGVDNPAIQVDNNLSSPHFGNVYVSTTQFGGAPVNTAIGVSHSLDGGLTWISVPVDSTQGAGTEDFYSHLAIGNDGTVYVAWIRCMVAGGGITCPGQPATLFFSKSVDGGNTWSAPAAMATPMLAPNTPQCGAFGEENLPNTCWLIQDQPSIAIDNSSGAFAGRLYVAFYNWTESFLQVLLASSTDGGVTWNTPVAVTPASDTRDQFAPWVSVSNSGMLGVTWLDRRKDPANIKYQPFAGFSRDGGATFFKNVALTTTASNPRISKFGNTFTTLNVWSSNTLYALWEDTRTGVQLAWFGGVMLK